MKAFTEYLKLNIPSKMAFENITPQVADAVRDVVIDARRFVGIAVIEIGVEQMA